MSQDSLLHSEACFAAQALVRLYLDLQEKHTAGVLREELQYDDVVATIELLVSQFSASMESLKVKPVFKRQQDNFDKILKVSVTQSFCIISELIIQSMVCRIRWVVKFSIP